MPLLRRSLLAVLALFALALPTDGSAQVFLGLNGGAVSSNFTADDLDFVSSNTGVPGGASLTFSLSDFFGIAPGVYYVQKGARILIPMEDSSLNQDWELAYLEVPLLGVFNVTGANRPVGVSLFMGPAISFEISCNYASWREAAGEVGEPSENECDGTEEGDAPIEREKKMDVGAIFGAGLAIPLSGSVAFTLNGGLDTALTTIDQNRFLEIVRSGNDEPLRPGDGEVKNSAWFVTGGLRFTLGG